MRRPRIRISGIVRAARAFQEELAGGVAPGGRDAFLDRARRAVEEIEALLRAEGATAAHLPVASRNAVAALRRIAAVPAAELPAPAPGAAPAAKVRVTGIERALRSALDALGGPAGEAEARERTRLSIERSLDGIRRACERGGSEPRGLPERSRQAFAMLQWLALPGNLDAYAARAAAARPLFEDLTRSRWPDSRLPAVVAFEPGRHLYKVRHEKRAHRWSLALGFLEAGPGDLEDLAAVIRRRRRTPAEVLRRHRAFVRAPEFAETGWEIEAPLEAGRGNPRGRARDLEALFATVNRRHFGDGLPRPRLHWNPSVSRRTFGTYTAPSDLVCVNPILDDPEVPEFVADFIVFHELLHKKHGPARDGGRRVWHTAAFRAEERTHPDFAEAKRWLDALAAGRRHP